MEVNEASCVIQEAAHEDANIIFGAVVDPNLGGKIKITVIATGFDKGARALVETPTDLTPYRIAANAVSARAAEQSMEAAVPQNAVSSQMSSTQMTSPQTMPTQMVSSQMASPQMASPQMTFASSITVNRRAPIELSVPLTAAGGGSAEPALEFDSPFDVPAFLRRQN